MINLIAWLLFGALAGWLASLIMKTDAEQGAIANIIVGIVGALVGGFFSNLLGGPGIDSFNFMSLLLAVLGASFLLFISKRAWH